MGADARMIGDYRKPWCWICHAEPGPDCPGRGDKGKRIDRERGKKEIRSQLAEGCTQD
jgi:hypothetical protein